MVVRQDDGLAWLPEADMSRTGMVVPQDDGLAWLPRLDKVGAGMVVHGRCWAGMVAQGFYFHE